MIKEIEIARHNEDVEARRRGMEDIAICPGCILLARHLKMKPETFAELLLDRESQALYGLAINKITMNQSKKSGQE